MTNFTRTISEGTGGYVGTGYISSGYIVSQTSMLDIIDGQLAATRTASQTITLTDAIPNLFIVRAIAQTLTNINTVARKLVATRELTTGAGGYTSSGYTASGYLVANVTLITETLGRVRDVPRTLTETLTNTNTVARIYAALRTIIPTLTVTETLGRVYAALRSPTETWVTTNSVARALVALRTITETLTITELITAFVGAAGEGARRIKEATTTILKRTGITTIFKRSANTST